MTPIMTREAVNKVLLLYRRRFRTAILKRLPIFLPSSGLFPSDLPVFQRIDDFRFPYDLLIVGRENESGLKFIPHLFHLFDDAISWFMIAVCRGLSSQYN